MFGYNECLDTTNVWIQRMFGYNECLSLSAACHRYPHLFTVHSTAHALDSGLERIGEIPMFKTVIEQAVQIVDIITTNETPSSVFRTHSPLRLVKPGKYCANLVYHLVMYIIMYSHTVIHLYIRCTIIRFYYYNDMSYTLSCIVIH